jgi:hypothetical protein
MRKTTEETHHVSVIQETGVHSQASLVKFFFFGKRETERLSLGSAKVSTAESLSYCIVVREKVWFRFLSSMRLFVMLFPSMSSLLILSSIMALKLQTIQMKFREHDILK